MKKRSRQIFKSTVSFLIIFLMVLSSVIQPSSKIKAAGFPNDAIGVSPDGKYYSAGNKNRLGMVTSDESHTPVELFAFCMANSKKYPGYDAVNDKYFGVYEQMLNLNKESFNKLVRDNHLPGGVSTGHDELWNKVSKLIYIYLKDPTDVIGRSGWATPQDAINEFYTVVQNEIWRYTDGYKVDKDSNQYWFYKYSAQGQKAVYLLREAVDSINVPADFELRGYKPEKVKNQIGFQAIVTGRLKKLQPVGEIKTTVTAGGKVSAENEIATLKAKDIVDGVEVSDKITYKGLYPNAEYDVIGKIYEVKDGELVNPGHPVSVVNSSTNLKPDATGKGEWTLNFGKLNLEVGKSYVVFETVVSLENVIDTDGDGKPDKKQELTHENPKDKSQTFTILPKEEVENEVVFSKVNIAGKEIAGAKIQIKDENGQVVKEWVSKEDQSETFKLKAGTYTFHEEAAPNGYLKVTDITFEVDKQGKVAVKNANGNEVKASENKLTVTDKEETSISEPWTPMIPSTRNLKLTKEWLGANGNQITAPIDKIEVELYRDGKTTGQKLELNKENNWTGEFKKLKVYESIENPKAYEYTVKEVGENKNSVLVDGERYKVVYEGSMKDGLTIINQKETSTKPSAPTPNDSESDKPVVSNISNNKTLAKTGDRSNVSQYAWIMLASGVLLMVMRYRRKN
ncbi:thioester-forming surface-anchored protein [Gemella morbillorum]